MKNILLSVSLIAFAGTAHAGALADPIVEPEIIIEDTAATSAGHWLVPALFVLFLLVGHIGQDAGFN